MILDYALEEHLESQADSPFSESVIPQLMVRQYIYDKQGPCETAVPNPLHYLVLPGQAECRYSQIPWDLRADRAPTETYQSKLMLLQEARTKSNNHRVPERQPYPQA